MDTGALRKFAQEARRQLRDQVLGKLSLALAENSAARREAPKAVAELEREIGRTSQDQVVERVAYTWFNRLTALRFMDANGYTAGRVVTPADGQTRPEVLSEAMAGTIGDEIPEATASRIRALLDSRTPSRDPQGEAYRLLLVAACNHWHSAMPFLFEKIADFTELLMPEDLLSSSSILARLRSVMTPAACQDVEIIGWLYQFYISEKKDEVFSALKNNTKISAVDIPAATQLFTPHWIVRFLVENSLGRLWMLNRPNSRLDQLMDYYIATEASGGDFLRISSPEEIRICDPACGSGHMLTYAFDLLHAIYEEEGYDAADIPGLILTHNLYGIELDERAGALAAFALTMKAAARRKRFLRRGVQPNVCVMEAISFAAQELNEYIDTVGRDLFTAPLRQTLTQFSEADNFGSLIQPALTDFTETQKIAEVQGVGTNLFLRDMHVRVLKVLRMADYLGQKYHVVVANPPYMGSKGMNGRLAAWARDNYPDSKSDLFAMFMERALQMTSTRGMMAMINMQSWMFLSSFEKLRAKLFSKATIVSMAHLGGRAFDTIGGAVVSTTAFIFENNYKPTTPGVYLRLVAGSSESEKATMARAAVSNSVCEWRYSASTEEFEKIPGAAVAYWASDKVIECFSKFPRLSEIYGAKQGLATAEDATFLRAWFEIGKDRTSLSHASINPRWFPFTKGGEWRKWYGNNNLVVDWERDGYRLKAFPRAFIRNEASYFRNHITWSLIGGGLPAFRAGGSEFIFGHKGPAIVCEDEGDVLGGLLHFLNSKVATKLFEITSPSLAIEIGHISGLPLAAVTSVSASNSELVAIAKHDWDSYETSWDFAELPMLSPERRHGTLEAAYESLRADWRAATLRMQRLEEQNNRTLIDAYGLQTELTDEVPLGEITLNCNPAYRYGDKKRESELEILLRADTIRELLSYAVGCMFGRYSLDAPGLILANQGEGLQAYLAKLPNPTFEPDADNVIPVLDGDWFADDIAARFRKFLRLSFGDRHFQENLAFVENALGSDIRRYFTREFFNDHVKRYKKRPIYWLFSSPKGTFNALIYMHRYRPDTVSVVLNDYLREFRSKLEAHRRGQEVLSISGEATPSQKAKALKEVEATGRQIEEIDAWERDVMFPLATQKIEIDLDDGVKANYPKFGAALKPIKGLNDADD
jgi:type II restriction/modification system DNA methylase subunit YeeA